MRLRMVLGASVLLALAGPAAADEVTDAMDRARAAYEAGDLLGTVTALNEAEAALQGRRAEALKAFMPAPLEGWTLQENDNLALAAEMLGGGYGISRMYMKPDGAAVSIDVMADSPMIAMMMAMFSNPQMLQMSGMKSETINGQLVVLDDTGSYQAMVANRFLVSVGGSASEEDKRAYISAVDFAGLAALK